LWIFLAQFPEKVDDEPFVFNIIPVVGDAVKIGKS
jgi:hypothetical protein